MKLYVALILAAVLLSACSTNKTASTTNAEPASSSQPSGPQAAAPQTTIGTPVELLYEGITPDKANISYKIKVNTDKPIEEVHLALKETDAGGKVVEQTMIAWQNIVHSTQQPIEKGKTYEDQTALDPTAVKAECTLKEVIFKDGTRWTAH